MEESSQHNNIIPPRPQNNILIGITGSVAAIKGPELAVRLAANANVRILLTQGGANFWSKAKDYNATAWNQMTELCQQSNNGNPNTARGGISIYCK
jgi:phosphopantothenoylcysteine synthetase/decarboxylase